jgi:hypothetical protein
MLRTPPRFVQGHNARPYWESGAGAERRRLASEDPDKSLFTILGASSLDAKRKYGTWAENVVDPATVDDHVARDAAERLHAIVGDMDPEDVRLLDSDSLERLRDRLRDEGLVPRGVQVAERVRLREPVAHTGAGVAQAPLIPGRKTRKQKVAHKAANANKGNSNRPKQKPRKRWTRA